MSRLEPKRAAAFQLLHQYVMPGSDLVSPLSDPKKQIAVSENVRHIEFQKIPS